MRRVMALGSLLGFALGLSIVPASADDPSIGQAPAQFHALGGLLDGKRAAPVPMTDEQLAAVEGMASNFVSIVCVNGACTTQPNSSAPSVGVLQSNLRSNAAVVKIVCVNGACTTQPNSSAPSVGVLQSHLQSILQNNAAVVTIISNGSLSVPIVLRLRGPVM